MPRSALSLTTLSALAAMLALAGAAAAQDVESGDIGPGTRWSHTFTAPMEKAAYHCHPHPWMYGEIVVAPSDGSAPTTHKILIVDDDRGRPVFTPTDLAIRVGDTVEWVVQDGRVHEIMIWYGEMGDHGHGDDGHGHGPGDHTHGAPGGPVLGVLVLTLALVALLRRR